MSNIKCDKCNSLDVTEHTKAHIDPPETPTMSEHIELTKQPAISYAVMTYTTRVLKCHTCGHSIEYTSQP